MLPMGSLSPSGIARTVKRNKTVEVKTINPSVESDLNRRISNFGGLAVSQLAARRSTNQRC